MVCRTNNWRSRASRLRDLATTDKLMGGQKIPILDNVTTNTDRLAGGLKRIDDSGD
jgi:hypothetical protein